MKVPLRIPLMSNRPRCSPPLRFGVWNARPLKTKVSSLCDLLLSRSLDHLSVTESWLTSNGSITTVDLTNSIEDYAVFHLPRSKIQDLDHLSVTELWLTSNDSIADLTNSLEDYAVYHSPRSTRRGGGLAVIARKGLRVSRNKGCILSSLKRFDLTITSGDKVYRLVTVYRPQPSKKKNSFTVERFFSKLSAFLEELTVTSCQFLVCGDFNFHVNDNSNANPKQFSEFLFSADLSSPIQAHWEHTLELVVEMWKRLLCCEMWNGVELKGNMISIVKVGTGKW